jgi:hypothetical protein
MEVREKENFQVQKQPFLQFYVVFVNVVEPGNT